jgi:hypothetical protein
MHLATQDAHLLNNFYNFFFFCIYDKQKAEDGLADKTQCIFVFVLHDYTFGCLPNYNFY